MDKKWFVYILRCGDGSLYTGISTDVEHRLKVHRSGKGAKYTRSHLPLELVYTEECADHSTALKREYAIKSLHKAEKNAIIEQYEKSHR